jgi:iron complex transport system substrate-binding protein
MYKLIALLTVFLLSCQTDQKKPKEQGSTSEEKNEVIATPLKYANCFEMTEQNDIRKLVIKNPFKYYNPEQTFVLLKNGQEYTKKSNEVILNIPLKSIIPFSTSYLSMIDTLGELNSIIGVENENYIYNPKLLKRITSKKVKTIGSSSQLNLEAILLSSPDALITIGTPGETAKQIQKLSTAGIPFIKNYDWQESHPLGKAEWIKFFGALYGKDAEANTIFNFIETNYNQLKQKKSEEKPSVLFSSLYNGVWYIPGGNSYASQYIKDAGGTYPWIDDSTKGSLPLSFETIANKQTDPNIWLNPNYSNLKEMTSDDERYFSFLNAVEGRVYNQNKRLNKLGGNDYWEKGSLRPDLILKDYIELFKLEGCNEDSLLFFSKLHP